MRRGLISGAIHVGAVLAEAGDARVDEARVDLRERFVVDAEAVLHVRTVVLDDHVGARRHALHELEALGLLEIDRDAALVSMQILEIRVVARGKIRLRVAVLVGAGLDLDHVRAPVAELAHAGGPGAHAREIEYEDIGQRPGMFLFGHCILREDSVFNVRSA